ncbi:MAG: DinB family protein [Bryobacteraceae bacterium]
MIELLVRRLAKQRAQAVEALRAIPEESLTLQPANMVNHAAWTLAHLHTSDVLVRATFTGSPVDKKLVENFANGSKPAPNLDAFRELFSSKDGLIEKMTASHAAAMDAVGALSDADLDRENPNEKSRGYFPTIGDLLTYLIWHEGYHFGQLSHWRKAAGV